MELKNFNNIEFLIFIILLLIFTEITIIFNISFIRQFLTIITYLILPGILILKILNFKEEKFGYKFIIVIGLNISFIIIFGIIINYILPVFGFSTPLTEYILSIIFSIIILIIAIKLYLSRYQKEKSKWIYNILEYKKSIYSPNILIPILFPIISIIGTILMNSTGNNSILLFLYLFIPTYIMIITFFHKKIETRVYPIAILGISIAILLSRSLTSNFLIGGDIYSEYHAFQLTLNASIWPGIPYSNMISNSLSVTIFPSIIQILSGINSLLIFKLIIIIIISIVPLICYQINSKYLNEFQSFLASLIVISQIPFIYLLSGHIRLGISLIFFLLIILLIFDDKLNKFTKQFLILVFFFSLILSYYVTPFIAILLFLIIFIFQNLFHQTKIENRLSFSFILVGVVFIFFWWGFLTNVGTFESYISLINNVIISLKSFFIAELRSPVINQMIMFSNPSIMTTITTLLNLIIFSIVSLGVLLIILSKKWRQKINLNYIILMILSLLILIAFMILPYISTLYGAPRLLLQLFPILTTAFIIGCIILLEKIKINLKFISILIAILFLFNSNLINTIIGESNSEILDGDNITRDYLYVYKGEVIGASWLNNKSENNTNIYLGSITQSGKGIFEFITNKLKKEFNIFSFREINDNIINGYVFLKFINIKNNYGYMLDNRDFSIPFVLEDYNKSIYTKNKIYSNSYCSIYK